MTARFTCAKASDAAHVSLCPGLLCTTSAGVATGAGPQPTTRITPAEMKSAGLFEKS